jgi:phospholipase D1/2
MRSKWLGLGLWMALLASYLGVLYAHGVTPLQAVIGALHWLKTDPLGPAAFCLAFVCRPIILVPASLLAVTAGHCFGVLGGEFWAMLAGLLAAIVVFFVGRLWHSQPTQSTTEGRFRKFESQLAEHGVRTTITMRCLMMPYDPISFMCGKVGVPLRSFMLGTFLGNIPGTTSCVLFGAGIKGDFHGQLPSIDWRMQGAAIALLAVAFLLQAWLKRRNVKAS